MTCYAPDQIEDTLATYTVGNYVEYANKGTLVLKLVVSTKDSVSETINNWYINDLGRPAHQSALNLLYDYWVTAGNGETATYTKFQSITKTEKGWRGITNIYTYCEYWNGCDPRRYQPSRTYEQPLITIEDYNWIEYNNGEIKELYLIKGFIQSTRHFDMYVQVNDFVQQLTGRPVTWVEMGLWLDGVVDFGQTIEEINASYEEYWLKGEEHGRGGIKNIYNRCEYTDSRAVAPPAATVTQTIDKITSPVSASQLNTKLLGRPAKGQTTISSELSSKQFFRWEEDNSSFRQFQTSKYSDPIKFSDFIGLSKSQLEYPKPTVVFDTASVDKGTVFAGSGNVGFGATFRVYWNEDNWPAQRERGSNDIIEKKVKVIVQEKRGTNNWEAVTSYNIQTPDSGESVTAAASIDTTTGIDRTSVESTLDVQIRFMVDAELRVVETLDSTNTTLPEEKYTTTQISKISKMKLAIASASDYKLGMGVMVPVYDEATVYKRTIDDTIAISVPQHFQFNSGGEKYENPRGVAYRAPQPGSPFIGLSPGYSITALDIPGRSPKVSVDWEWQVKSRTDLSLDWGSLDRLSSSDGSFPLNTERSLIIEPLNDAWQSYVFRFSATPTITLRNPDETVVLDTQYGPVTLLNELIINYYEKDPEYVLPTTNTITVSSGFTATVDFYTRWTGDSTKTYYWRIEDVTSGATASTSVWNTVQGSFDNDENLLLSSNDAGFNKNEITLDSKPGAATKNYRLSVYKNSDYTGLAARTVFKLQEVASVLELTSATVVSSETLEYDKDSIQTLGVIEGDTVSYVGQALNYGEGRTLYWRYSVTTDPDDSGDVVNEFSGYAPDTYHAVTTVAVPGSGTSTTGFSLPNLTTVVDSGSSGLIDRKEVIEIEIYDDAYVLKDKVILNNNDKIIETFVFNKQPQNGSLTYTLINDNYTNVLKTGSGVMGFSPNSKPYTFKSPSGVQSITKEGWQRKKDSSWLYEADYYGANTSDVFGNSYQSTRVIDDYRIVWSNWASKTGDEIYRYAVEVYDSIKDVTNVYTSSTAKMTFTKINESYNKGVIAGNLEKSYQEGEGPIKLWVKTWDSLGMTVDYTLSDDDLRASLINGPAFDATSTVKKSGSVTIPSTGPRLREDTFTLPTAYVGTTKRYGDSRFNPYAYWVPDAQQTVTLTGSDKSTAQGKYSVTNIGVFDPNDFTASSMSVTVSGITSDTSTQRRVVVSESFDNNWTVTVTGINIPPAWQTAGKWIVGISGDAAKHWKSSLSIQSADINPIRATALSDFVFNNDAATAQKRFDGRYVASATLPPPAVLADESKDLSGKIEICYQTTINGKTVNSVVWSRDIIIINSVPEPWVANNSQIYVVADNYSVTEGDSVKFYVKDKVKSDNTDFDNWNNETPIPTGTNLYFKVHTGTGGTSADFTTSPAISGGYGTLTVDANGDAGPITVTFTDDSDVENTEQFEIRVSTDASTLDKSGGYAASGFVDVADNDLNPAISSNIPGALQSFYSYGNCAGTVSRKAQLQLTISSDGDVKTAVAPSFGINAGLLPALTSVGAWLPSGASASDYTCRFDFIEATGIGVNSGAVLKYVTGDGFGLELECDVGASIGLEAPRCLFLSQATARLNVIITNKNDGSTASKECMFTISQEQ